MGLPEREMAGSEMGRGIYHRRWDIQDGKWQVVRWEEEFTTGDGTSKMGTGREGDGKRNLPHDMGLPRARLEDFDPATGEGKPHLNLWRNRGNTTGSMGNPIMGGTQRENDKHMFDISSSIFFNGLVCPVCMHRYLMQLYILNLSDLRFNIVQFWYQ